MAVANMMTQTYCTFSVKVHFNVVYKIKSGFMIRSGTDVLQKRKISLLFFQWCFVISVCIKAQPQASSSQEVYISTYDIFMLYLKNEKLISNFIYHTFMLIMNLKPKNTSPIYFITNRLFITNYILKQLHSSS